MGNTEIKPILNIPEMNLSHNMPVTTHIKKHPIYWNKLEGGGGRNGMVLQNN